MPVDPYRGETLKAFVVSQPGQTIDAEQVIAFCRERLAGYKVPRFVESRTALPKSGVGKYLRRELRREETEARTAKAAVVGAGAMGAPIAAHPTNVTIPVLLLDVAPTERTPDEHDKGSERVN